MCTSARFGALLELAAVGESPRRAAGEFTVSAQRGA
jgi:hypothetical protein